MHKLLSSSLPVLCFPFSSTQEHLLVLFAVPGFCAPAPARTIGTRCTSENEPEGLERYWVHREKKKWEMVSAAVSGQMFQVDRVCLEPI